MPEKKPNLIIVFPDQMRAHQLGFLGLEPVITPHLNKFAEESLVLTQAAANFPVCSPYRAMLMTGKYSPSNKVVSNCTNRSEPYNCELQESDICWSDVLKDNGYSLGYIGKWHLDSPKAPYLDCYNNKGEVKWNEWCPPHTPYDQVPEKYIRMYDELDVEELGKKPSVPPKGTEWGNFYRKHVLNQYGMITGIDEQFGRIMEALDKQGLSDETIVLFTADHGDCVGIHEHNHKNIEYEESMRIPFLIRWPGKIKPRHDDLLISVPDYYPTLIALMGFKDEIPQDVEGKSFAEYFLDNKGTKPKSQLYCFMKFDAPEYGKRGVRTATHTLSIEIYPETGIDMVLFDNVNDPYQMVNVAGENKDLIETLIKTELVPWVEVSHDPWLKLVPGLLKEMNENWAELSAVFGDKATERVRPFQK